MDKETRIERLKLLAKRHGLLNDQGEVENPAAFGELIGKKPNQVYNLLHGTGSFGEKVARSIEEKAQLPIYWLDGKDAHSPVKLSTEALAIATEIDTFVGTERARVIAACNNILALARPKRQRPPMNGQANQGK